MAEIPPSAGLQQLGAGGPTAVAQAERLAHEQLQSGSVAVATRGSLDSVVAPCPLDLAEGLPGVAVFVGLVMERAGGPCWPV